MENIRELDADKLKLPSPTTSVPGLRPRKWSNLRSCFVSGVVPVALAVSIYAALSWSLPSWETITTDDVHPADGPDCLVPMTLMLTSYTLSVILLNIIYRRDSMSGQKTRHRRKAGLVFALGIYTVTLCGMYAWFVSGKYRSVQKVHHLFGKRAEKLFLSTPNTTSAVQASRKYATKPHMAGTPGDFATAKEFLALLQNELGVSVGHHSPEDVIFKAGSAESQRATHSVTKTHHSYAWIDTYYPVMNTPLDRTLEIVDNDGSTLLATSLVEIADSTDPDANKYSDDVPTFHGYSRGGDVTGPLIDGNYCMYEDYQRLVQSNVQINGSIVLCRYGGIVRGLKVKGAQELGAVGVLIYSDPRDDGTVTTTRGYNSYPYGPARNPTSVERGSVQYISIYPGDPTTPGYPSYENSTRTEGTNIPTIPSLPISWANANIMFRTLTAGDELEGKHVRLVNNVDIKVTPIWNTMGVIPGYIKDEVVVIGNHRDAWVLGATDPSSGTASVHEVVRGLGRLLRNGWKPLRTIVIASWDAEEYGLTGSTEWGEDFKDWVDAHVVAYLNLDTSVSGSRLHAAGSPLLAHFIRGTAEELPHPTDKGRTLWDATTDEGTLFGLVGSNGDSIHQEVLAVHQMQRTAVDPIGVAPLGSGSDFTVFLQRNGVPSSDGSFEATLHDPVYHYHSVFDSQRWQELWGDPGFFRHVAIAKHLGLQTLRLATSPLLPFNTTHYAYEIESYLNDVEDLATAHAVDIDFSSLRKSIYALQEASISLEKDKVKANRELQELLRRWKRRHSVLRRAARRLRKMIRRILNRGSACHGRDLDAEEGTDTDMALGMLLHADPAGDGALARALAQGGGTHRFPVRKLLRVVKRLRELNRRSAALERGFISQEGIHGREWYKHLVVAPGKWLGYGATMLPAISEAIQYEKNATLAQDEVKRLGGLVDKIVKTISD